MKSGLFFFKKLVSRLFLTFTLPWLMLLVGIFFPSWLPWLVVFWLVLLWLAGPLGGYLLWGLGHAYPRFSVSELASSGPYLIGVAGSGFMYSAEHVPETWFSDEMQVRMSEAGRVAEALQRRGISFRLMVSLPEHPEQEELKLEGLQAFFARYSVPAALLSVLDGVLDSEDELECFRNQGLPVIVVSSLWHVPRFMLMGKLMGCEVHAAPAGRLSKKRDSFLRGVLRLPSASGLSRLECALHELVGMLMFRLFWRPHQVTK